MERELKRMKGNLTVSEYANAKNISNQAVYKQMNGKLKPFVKVIEGQKYIDSRALNESEVIKVATEKSKTNPTATVTINQEQTNQLLKLKVEMLEKENERLWALLGKQAENNLGTTERNLLTDSTEQPIRAAADGNKREREGFIQRAVHTLIWNPKAAQDDSVTVIQNSKQF